MAEDKIDQDIVKFLGEEKLSIYIPRYGDRVFAKNWRELSSSEMEDTEPRKTKLINSIREKMKLPSTATATSSSHSKPRLCGNKNAEKKTRKIELGWMNYQDSMYKQVRVQARHESARAYDSHSSSTISSDAPPPAGGKPPPPPVALKPSFGPRHSQSSEEHGQGDQEDPASRSFLGKVKAFEQMDHLARAQRMLELQEAENARLEIAQKHPDIYAIPVKPKPNLNRPQPIGSSSNPEPQAPSSRPPYSESRAYRGGDDDDEEEYRRQLADQNKRGYFNPQKYKDTEL